MWRVKGRVSIFDQLLVLLDDQPDSTSDEIREMYPFYSLQQIASTVGRLDGRGWLDSRKTERGPGYRLSEIGNERITQVLSTIRQNEQPWNDEWLWVVAKLPETERKQRDLLRLELNRLGFGRLLDGLYLHPWPRQAELAEIVRRLAIGSSVLVFVNRTLGRGTTQLVIDRAWHWPELSSRLSEFLTKAQIYLASVPANLAARSDKIQRRAARLEAKNLVFEYGQILTQDPNFPIGYVPHKEPYLRAKKLYEELRRYCYL